MSDVTASTCLDAEEIRQSLMRDWPDNDQTLRAFQVSRQLQDWVDANANSLTPVVILTVERWGIGLAIGHMPVWDSEGCSDDDLTFEKCRAEYVKEIMDYAAIIREYLSSEDRKLFEVPEDENAKEN